MTMSPRERSILEGIDDDITHEDPQLAARFAEMRGSRPKPWNRKAVSAGALVFALGIALMVAGSAVTAQSVIFVGLALAVVAPLWIGVLGPLLRRRRSR